MSKIEVEKKKKRIHIVSKLMKESLVSESLQEKTYLEKEFPILPDVNILKIGGSSIIDRGKSALFPLVEEIGRLNKKHKMIVGVGGGIREKHTYAVGLDLGLPLGGLAIIGGAIPEQNALFLQVLLAKYGGIRVAKEDFEKLPLFLKSGAIPVVVGMPPYHYWEHPAKDSCTPPHGSDTGMFLMAEVFSAKNFVLLKDVDGVYTQDPKRNKKAKLIKRIEVNELLKMDMKDLPVERKMLEIFKKARNCKKIHIINGLKKGTLTKVLKGEPVGTVIFKNKQRRKNEEK